MHPNEKPSPVLYPAVQQTTLKYNTALTIMQLNNTYNNTYVATIVPCTQASYITTDHIHNYSLCIFTNYCVTFKKKINYTDNYL